MAECLSDFNTSLNLFLHARSITKSKIIINGICKILLKIVKPFIFIDEDGKKKHYPINRETELVAGH